MQGETFWGTTNIKVAAAVASFGGKPRQTDPVTRFIKEDGSQQVTFWFQAGEADHVRIEMERPWAEMKCDAESPIRYVRAALENRETLLGLVKRSEPIKVVRNGEQTLIISNKANSEQKKAILRHI